MNYERIYNEFIADRKAKEHKFYRGLNYYGRITKEKRARERGIEVPYMEHHHIDPQFSGGVDSADNILTLSYREHFFIHLLLAKIHGGRFYAALWSVAGMIKSPTQKRTVVNAMRHSKLNERIRTEMAKEQRGKNNRRADLTKYEWCNVVTGERITATRHDMPFSSSQACDYFAGYKKKKWPVRFAAGEWYILGMPYATHEDAEREYYGRSKRRSLISKSFVPKGSKHPRAARVVNLDTGVIYATQREAAIATGAHQPKISEVCNGTRKTAGGYRWAIYSD